MAGARLTRGLRFCMVTTFYPPHHFGGDAISVQRLARALVRRGHQVAVLYDVDAYRAFRADPEHGTDTEDDGVEILPVRSRLGRLSPVVTHQVGRPLANARAIQRVLDSDRFDVVNFHNVSLIGGPGILSMGSAVKLYTAREHWLVCPTHVLWRHGREPCTGRECLRCVVRQGRPPQLWRYTGYLERQLAHIDAFIALSDFSRAKHREFGFRRPMEVVPPLAPDSSGRDVETEPPPHRRPYFLFAGRLERMKGLDDVIPIFRDYREADLLIAGDGTHAARLRRLADGIEHVRFLGRKRRSEIDFIIRHALAVIAPSVGFETFGTIVLDAFRQSTPVIARRVGPYPEILARGGGQLFDRPDELRDAMARIQGDPAHRRRLGESAYRAFRSHWSEAAVIPRYLDVVRLAANRRGHTQIARALDAQMAGSVPPPVSDHAS